jgi:phospholipase/carboxylesterase
MKLLEFEEVSCESPKQAVIWLHGLGADGYDFVPIAQELNLPDTDFIFPHAPTRPITINNGMQMRGWYDIASLERFEQEDKAGMLVARDQIENLIELQLAKGLKAENIILAGFSQGGVMALFCGLSYPQKISKIIALSCYLPMRGEFDQFAADANKTTPIFMAHGTFDPIVHYQYGDSSARLLQAKGYDVTWKSYPMQHQVCADEIIDIRKFLV